MNRPCEAWDAVYDNLPVMDSRIWSREDLPAALSVEFPTRPTGFAAVEHGQALELIVHFATGWHGMIYLSPEGIRFEACGALTYTVGEPKDTVITAEADTLKFLHNGYAYEIPVDGHVQAVENGYRITQADRPITLHMTRK